ncbi:MAG: hypothetical protein FRX48_06962 [Lasallia pustulata]|uniref:Uncharacterized protein n=1 Tax=Lasallia pustulata TaxID=136370 RepID=A0A5M8PJ17_9LECA|nr:MAG: hypothetical protein FRX48_06962 [Lasallia pustulata]
MILSKLSLLLLTLCPQPSHPPALASAHVLPTRAQHCSNAPATVAGTKLTRRIPVLPRDNNYIWCVFGTETYITTQMLAARVAAPPLLAMINEAYGAAFAHLMAMGDGWLPSGQFEWETPEVRLSMMNANNRQMTWGVLASALWGLQELIQQEGAYTVVQLLVYDGIHQVGRGSIVLNIQG